MTEKIPQHWRQIPLKELVIQRKGKKPSRLDKKPFSNSLPYLDIKAIEKNIVSEYANKDTSIVISDKDLLMVWDGARSGKIWRGREGVLGSTIMAITPIKINQNYIYYFLNSKYEDISKNTMGIGIPHVDGKFLWNLEIPLPPLKEQDKIVQTLDNLFIRLSQFKKRLSTIPKLLRAYKELVLRKAVTGELTKEWRRKNQDVLKPIELANKDHSINTEYKKLATLPNEWSWVALGNYANCSRGKFSARPRNDPAFYDGKYPFIQIGDLPDNGGFIHSHKQTLNEQGLSISKMFSKNTVAIAIVGATIGNTGILDYDMCFPDSLIGINTKIDYSNFFIEYYLRQEKNNLREISYSSGGQPNIKLPIINSYPLPLPPLKEQKEIVERLSKLFKKADILERYYQDALLYFENIGKVILQKAFTGKLVKPANDETTVVTLLENIKIEKERLQAEFQESKKERHIPKKMKPTNKSIYEILKISKEKEMPAEEVWKKSKYHNDIEKFYENLRDEVETKKRVKETKVGSGEGSVLSLQ